MLSKVSFCLTAKRKLTPLRHVNDKFNRGVENIVLLTKMHLYVRILGQQKQYNDI